MISKKIMGSLKNAMGTVFLLAGAFFVCSTLLSVRAVFADPIAPVNVNELVLQQGARSNVNARTSARTSPRTKATVARTTVARTAVPAGNAGAVQATTNARANTPRTLVLRPGAATNARANASRANTVGNAPVANSRNVVARTTNVINRANANLARNVRARTATTDMANNARISLQGSAIRGSKTSDYLTVNGSRIYTGNYSNIIDSTTGLISADAYSNCMESYYTCMDEICTARNAAQRRCACAGRVKAFASAEAELEKANEELIRASGELALLIANKGKEVSDAFRLTDAEKVLNCVSWKEMYKKVKDKNSKESEADMTAWCQAHGIYNDSDCNSTTAPDYCYEGGNNFGFNIDDHDLDGSDILAQLQSWAKAKNDVTTIILDVDNQNLLQGFEDMSELVSGLTGTLIDTDSEKELKDTLAETWGYELFEYAHNNVCARVLDSCFNGIYEACGTPPTGAKCANGVASCPYNYNSKITVKNTGEYTVDFITANDSKASGSATCFGYTSTAGDPYANLRGPVADARRSIMQKYVLDANADCDLYGEQLRATAQNIAYQKVAAEQALQQKRLEFVTEERETMLADGQTALSNFHECISEIWDCYNEMADEEDTWSSARIKTYCSQVANVPHCYEEMICRPLGTQFTAVIDTLDSENCNNSTDYQTNTCRNVVTLNEILHGVAKTNDMTNLILEAKPTNSEYIRELCLRDTLGLQPDGSNPGAEDGSDVLIRNWTKNMLDKEGY